MGFLRRMGLDKAPDTEARGVREARAMPRGAPAEVGSLPEATIAFCKSQGLLPEPPVYEAIYTHLGGENPGLSTCIETALASGPLTQAGVMRIHDEFLNSGTAAQRLGKIGAGIGREVEDASGALSEGIQAGDATRDELARLTAAIAREPNRQTLVDQALRMREIGLAQLSANVRLRERLHYTQNRLSILENELLEHIAVANTDHLTKLANRRALHHRLNALLARPRNPASPECFIMVDVDGFRQVNEVHGHDIGDNILRKLAEILSNGVRPDNFVGRWGGEKFAILMGKGGGASAVEKAEHIRRTLEAFSWTRKKDGGEIGTVTASFGVCERRDDDTAESFAQRADAALHRAKADGRNRVFFIGDSGDGRPLV